MTTTTKKRVRIIVDTDIESPRDWDNFGTMVCWHNRYNLGDDQPRENSSEFLRNLAAEYVGADDPDLIPDDHLARILDKYFVILPLYLYDHSGISMSCSGFSCPWDSGQVGYIYASLDDARANWMMDESANWESPCRWIDDDTNLRDGALRNLRAEVETYDQFLRGEVYGFVVEEREHCAECGHDDWEMVDSCFGFFGHDPRTNGMADHLGDDALVALACDADVEYL